jgi:uncharacterized protein (TIGR00369 family)
VVLLTVREFLQKYLDGNLAPSDQSPMIWPPAIGKTLGIKLLAIGQASATFEMSADPALHANPMGTIHGGILCDLADAAIGTAHATTLGKGESFTSLDLKINFFRPVWKETIRAEARVIQLGKTISYYTCDVLRADGKTVATVSSTVMTLRGDQARGR